MTEVDRAVQLLKQGRLVVFPTETVYGLGADATNPAAIERIYQTKGRPSTNPLIVHVADVATAKRFVIDWPNNAEVLARQFWPGPLTLILPKHAMIPDIATAGLGTVAIRVPDHPLALQLLREFAGPLAAPSANRSTRVSPTTARHVLDEFPDSAAAGGDAEQDPAMILDGGPCTVGIESTVLDLTTLPPTIRRPGMITEEQIYHHIGAVHVFRGTVDLLEPSVSPGQHDLHYAPRCDAYRFTRDQIDRVKELAMDSNRQQVVAVFFQPHPPEIEHTPFYQGVHLPADADEVSRVFYTVLRLGDLPKVKTILMEMPPDTPEWAAIRDRLIRATRPLPVR